MSVPVPIKTEEVILESVEYNSADEFDDELQLQLEDSGGESYVAQYSDTLSHAGSQRQRHNSTLSVGNVISAKNSSSGGAASNIGGSPANRVVLDSEKRLRREIANSNERRRMQSINAGFQNLRQLLPRHEGEKLSKAAILQQTSQYILELETTKTQLLAQNSQLKRQLGQHESGACGEGGSCGANNGNESTSGVALKKRKLTDNVINIQTISDSSDEGLGSMSPEPMTLLSGGATSKGQVIITHAAAKELVELKKQLDKERRLRTILEDEMQAIKRQLYSVATAPTTSASGTTSYIQREVIEHTDNLRDDELSTVSYLEIDEMGSQQVVVCSSIEELENEAAAAAAEIITEDNVHEEVILSSNDAEQEVNAIAKAYAEGSSPSASVLQPILQAAIKATPKVEVERINDTIIKVKTEKIEQPSGLTRSRQNLETIVEAIRHLEGDHLFGDVAEHQKLHQDVPLALTTKQQQTQRATLNELRPFLQLKNKHVTIVGNGGASVTLTHAQLANAKAQKEQKEGSCNASVTPTAIFKVQTSHNTNSGSGRENSQQVTITTNALKQCRPGVIVAKQVS